MGEGLDTGLHYLEYRPAEFDALEHTHGEYNITLCVDRSFRITRRGQEEDLECGDLIVINPGEPHHSRYGAGSEPTKGLTFFVTKRLLDQVLARMHRSIDWGAADVRFTRKVRFPPALALAQSIAAELEQKPAGCELVVEACMVQFLVYLLRNCLEPAVEGPKVHLAPQLPSWQMIKAIEYMNRQGKADLSIGGLCQEIGSSASRFIRLFKNSAGGVSPHQYYNRLLVFKAGRMLQDGSSVKDAAYSLGFRNDSHFCTLFRKLTGLTPRAYQEGQQPGAAPGCRGATPFRAR
jgi:AraC-like DNA-binding protein